MRAIVSTTSSGSWPMAVSAESMTASVPSNTALATSLTSARVGAGAVIMLSSIWVAVMTGTPASTQARMICFCRWGTSSSGHSMPRSPRATITASADDEDAVEVGDGRCGLDLGHQRRAARRRSRRAPRRCPRRRARTTPRRSRRPRAAMTFGQAQVLGRGGLQPQPLGRDVHARAALGPAAGDDRGVARRRRSTDVDLQRDGAVAEDHACRRHAGRRTATGSRR